MSAEAYQVIHRAISDSDFFQQLNADPTTTLRGAGVTTDLEMKETLSILNLMALGLGQQNSIQNIAMKKMMQEHEGTLRVASELKDGLKHTLDQIDQAFRSTKRMYEVSFYLGVFLILCSVFMAFISRAPLLPAVFGTLGTLDILTFFLTKPQQGMQASRASLAQLQAALYNWFMDSVNLNTKQEFLNQANRMDEAAAVSEALMAHTEKTLEMLQKYCKQDISSSLYYPDRQRLP